MRKKGIIFFVFFGLVLYLVGIYLSIKWSEVKAETESKRLFQLTKEIEEYEKEISRLKSQANTLANQIAQFEAQIRLTSLKISQTEEKISILAGRIDQLEISLQSLTRAFASRIVRTYKMSRLSQPVLQVLLSRDLNSAVSSYYYLQKIQEADRDLLIRLEKAQGEYQKEKIDQEILQKELENQKAILGLQKAAKAKLLDQTRNDEKKYQELLARSRAEYEAIQAIIAGKGQEEEVGKISQGQKIATIIQGASCNSSGTHLHFTVRKADGTTENPFNYLKPGISYEDNSGGDPFNPSGSWEWPVNPPVKFNQGYGSDTLAIRSHVVWYGFHNGIDINSLSSPDVKAVKSGTLYRGSYSGNGGCRLRYMRIDHDDSDLDTLYLHINY